MRGYLGTLFSSATFGLVGVHTLEDIVLLSIGRFAPVPVAAMYVIGLLASWLVMGALLHKILGRKNEHHQKEFRENRKRGLLPFAKWNTQNFAVLMVIFLIVGGLIASLSYERGETVTPADVGQPITNPKIAKLDCGALANYWEGESGESVGGAQQKVLKLTNATLVSRWSGKLTCEADLITDMFLGQRAQLIAELVEDEVWHSFAGFHAGLYITKK